MEQSGRFAIIETRIPFAFSLALSLILWWMTTWSIDADARTRAATKSMRGVRDRRELKEKDFAKQLDTYGWDRFWAEDIPSKKLT